MNEGSTFQPLPPVGGHPAGLSPSAAAAVVSGALAPVTIRQRVESVDVLRGFALLGILAMNIVAFALPSESYMNAAATALEPYQGKFEGANKISWIFTHIVFDQKMMSIFSMLFGAGLVLMGGRAAGRGAGGFAGVYYRRLLVLLGIGLAHAYLIWYGDILVAYAICGVFLYPARRLRPRTLIIIGIAVMTVAMLISGVLGGAMMFLRYLAQDAQRALDAGQTLSQDQVTMLEQYKAIMNRITPEVVEANVAAMRGSVGTVLAENARLAAFFQSFLFGIWTFWRALGLMLIGMGLMKLGVFSATRSRRFYLGLAGVGLGIGLPMAAAGTWYTMRHGFDPILAFVVDWPVNYVASTFVALGYVGAVMAWRQSGSMGWLQARLAAVGRMALTNYLMQSLLMTFVFFGWGLGYYGTVERAPLYLFVLGVWVIQLVVSPWWLSRFQFGPAEWLWRWATYLRRPPISKGSISSEPLAS